MVHKKNKYTVLIIEDEVSLRGALRDKFSREGFLVLDAKDGEAGLVLALAKKPHLILLDIVMPKMDGMTMLQKLRVQGEWAKNVPVMLLTNLGSDDEKIMKEIADDPNAYYLVKSNWPINNLIQKVRETLSS